MEPTETLVLLKPDTVERNLVGTVLTRFETEGLEIVAMRTVEASQALLADHYKEHVDESYYEGLVEYMQSGPVIAVLLDGENAVQRARALVGDTEPASADPGTIRGDLGRDSYAAADAEDRGLRNLVHAAEDPDAAARERDLWFPNH